VTGGKRGNRIEKGGQGFSSSPIKEFQEKADRGTEETREETCQMKMLRPSVRQREGKKTRDGKKTEKRKKVKGRGTEGGPPPKFETNYNPGTRWSLGGMRKVPNLK